MRILHITPYYYPAVRYGGPVRSVHGLCKNLVRLGHDIHVLTTNLDGPSTVGQPLGVPVGVDGVKVWYFPSPYGKRLFFSPEMGNKLSREIDDFDLLHIHTFFNWPSYIAASAAVRYNVPYILSPRGMLVKDLVRLKNRWVKSAWIRIIGRRIVENAARIHATTDAEAEEIRRFRFNLPPVLVLPVGLNTQDRPCGPPGPVSAVVKTLSDKKPLLLFLGRVNWKKGLDRLIPALSYVKTAHLAVAGNDEENYRPVLDRLARKHQVADRITFTGPIRGEAKRELFKEASVFILPSYSENFGVAVLEAMAAGVPVVVTPEVGLARAVEEAGAGLVLPGDPETLGAGLQALLADPGRLREMGTRGRGLAATRFAWCGIATEMARVYNEIICRPDVYPGH